MIETSFIILILSFLIFYVISKLSIKLEILTDTEYTKKQSFHNKIKSNTGGLCILLILLICNFFNIDFFSTILINSIFFFIIGFFDDLKIITSPFIRFFSIVVFIIFLIVSQNFYVLNFGFPFFSNYINEITLIILTIIGFFLVLNGANLIDGFNGLLSIHSFIILIVIIFLFREKILFDREIIIFILIALIVFLYFNLIKQNLFLGDSGAYFLGSLIAISVVEISNVMKNISPFFFAILLFYLYFETLFSVTRKLYEGKNPFKPDEKHLHMLFYKYLKKKKINSPNNLTGISINVVYILLILPAIFFLEKNLICIFYFLFLHIVYLIFYKVLREKY